MSPTLASAVCGCGILCLFLLDEESGLPASWSLWIPVIWLLIAGSRHVSAWLNMSPAVSVDQYLEGSPLDRVIYALLVAAGGLVLIARRKKVGDILRRNWPLVLFVGYCVVSVLWSDFPGVAFKRWVKSLGDYAIVLIMLTEYNRPRALKRVLSRVGFVLLPLSILFIKYYPQLGRMYASHWDGTQFYVGVADTKNMLGMTCMVFGFAAFWSLLQPTAEGSRRRWRKLLVHGSMVAMAVWLLLLSNSKTSLICFIAASGVIGAHALFKVARRKLVVHLMSAAVILVSFTVLFLGIGSGVLETMGRDSTLTGRTDIWRAVLDIPVNPLVGTGFESFWLGSRLDKIWSNPELYHINEAHNGYLEVYLNLGFVGLALIALLLIAGYRNVVRSLARDPNVGRLQLGYFLIAVTYNFTEAAIRSTDLVWIAFLIALIAVPEKRRVRPALTKKYDSLVTQNLGEVSGDLSIPLKRSAGLGAIS